MLLEALVLALGFGSEKMKNATSNYEFEKRQKEISKMDTWDGIEARIRDHLTFYREPDYVKVSVKWNNKSDKYVKVSLLDVETNRKFQKSGLSMEEFAKKCFMERYKKYGDSMWRIWGDSYTPRYAEINLFNENGECHTFTSYSRHLNGKCMAIYYSCANSTQIKEIATI